VYLYIIFVLYLMSCISDAYTMVVVSDGICMHKVLLLYMVSCIGYAFHILVAPEQILQLIWEASRPTEMGGV
jgi:hypothetical protein